MMGDGVIDIPRIRGWVEDAGFAGYSEVEIFSTANWWQREHGRGAGHLHRAAPHGGVRTGASPRFFRQAAAECTCRPGRAALAARAGAEVPKSISPDNWPPSSITTLP